MMLQNNHSVHIRLRILPRPESHLPILLRSATTTCPAEITERVLQKNSRNVYLCIFIYTYRMHCDRRDSIFDRISFAMHRRTHTIGCVGARLCSETDNGIMALKFVTVSRHKFSHVRSAQDIMCSVYCKY